jgi:hypothetical protein
VLERPLLLRKAAEKPASCRPAERTSSIVSTPGSLARRLVSAITSATIVPIMSRTSARCILSAASRPTAERSRASAARPAAPPEARPLDQPGAKPVVHVVIVVGDIVGDGRDLRLERRPAVEP